MYFERLILQKYSFKATLKAIENPKVYQYTISNGINELREQIALRYTNEGFATTKENSLITTGSQQAMYILAKFFENRDITIEEPSYLGAMNIFRTNHSYTQSLH